MTEEQKKLVSNNMKLVGHYLKRLNYEIPIDDYYDYTQVGYVGLCRAAMGFDSTRGLKFSSFAMECIKNEILSYIDRNNLVKLKRGFRIFTKTDLVNCDEDTKREIICEKLNMSKEEYNRCLPVMGFDGLRFKNKSDEDLTILDVLKDPYADKFIEEVEDHQLDISQLLIDIREELSETAKRHRGKVTVDVFIDYLKYVITGVPYSFTDQAKQMGISKQCLSEAILIYKKKLKNTQNPKLKDLKLILEESAGIINEV